MVLASEQDPDLELVSDLDEGPPVLTPIENTRTESVSCDEEVHESVDSDNQQNKKVEGIAYPEENSVHTSFLL